MPLMSSKVRAGILLALQAIVITGLLMASGALQRLEWIAYDSRMRLFRSEAPLHPDVAVILIDESSLSTLEPIVGRWPWPRSVYADLIDFVAIKGGARAVLFDVLFTERSSVGGVDPNDERLIATSQDAGNVYHAAQIITDPADEIDSTLLNRPMPESFRTRFAVPATGFGDGPNNNYSLPLPKLFEASRGIGVVGMDADADGIFRRTNLFFSYQGEVYPSLALAGVLDSFGLNVRKEGSRVYLGDTPIPLDRDGRFLVNMAGRVSPYSAGGIFASIQKMERGDLENLKFYPDEFAGKIVFVGASAVGLEDIKTTPVSAKTPGVMIHASAVSNLLDRQFLRQVSPWTDFIVAALMASLTVFLILRTQKITLQLGLPAALMAAYAAVAFVAFDGGLVLGMAAPLTAVGLSVLGCSAFLVFTEGRDKRRVRAMFSQYVSPAVLSELVERRGNQIQAEVGTREHLSILFSDVRGFTSLSEKLQAEQVVDLLNIHFSVMSEIIFRYDGTLDKFIGDAIMAFWGAPIRVPDHARRAVCAGIEMERAIVEVNAQLAAKGYPPIAIGLGINTGDMVLGNIGSERKLDYTVIGDHVNLGSRLEGLTKQYGCPLIISEFTHQELAGALPCAVVDVVRVKGKQQPIRIYWPLAHPDDPAADIDRARSVAELSERAFALYLERRFEEAGSVYGQLPDSALKDLFVARCLTYSKQPPAVDWDGVYTLTTK